LSQIERIGELNYTKESIYNYQKDSPHHFIDQFKKRAGSYAISIIIQVENYSFKLLGNPIVTHLCSQAYQNEKVSRVTKIQPLTKNAFIFTNHGLLERRTCGTLSFQIKSENDTAFAINEIRAKRYGVRVMIPWHVNWACNRYDNRFQTYFDTENVELTDSGNWKFPRGRNKKSYKAMMDELSSLAYTYKEKDLDQALLFHRRNREFTLLGIMGKSGCNPLLRVILYEDGVAFRDLSKFNVSTKSVVLNLSSYHQHRAQQVEIVAHICIGFGSILLIICLVKAFIKIKQPSK